MTIPGLGASWKTTLAGLSVLGGTAAQQAISQQGMPQSGSDWISFLVQLIIGLGLLLSKDHNVSNAQIPGEAKPVV